MLAAILFAFITNKQNNRQSVYRGNPQHTGCYEGAGIGANSSVVWKFKTGDKVFSASNLHGIQTGGKIVEDPWDMYL